MNVATSLVPTILRRNFIITLQSVDAYGRESRQIASSFSIHAGETSRRFYSRVLTKFQDNTIVSLGGKSTFGPNRSQKLADEMADGWKRIMTRTFACSGASVALLSRSTPLDRVNDSTVTSYISTDDVSAALKWLKRGKVSGPDEINNNLYRLYADALGPIPATFYTRWLTCSVFPASLGKENIQCLNKSPAFALPLDHRPIALLNSAFKVFTKIRLFRGRTLLSHLVLSAQAGFLTNLSIHTTLDFFAAVRKPANLDSDLHGAIVLILDYAKA